MDKDLENPPGGRGNPGEDSLCHIRGDFVPVSPWVKARSSSPRRRVHRRPIHVRVNFTDKQMEKITDAFAFPRDRDQMPSRARHHQAHYSDSLTPSNNGGYSMHVSTSSLDKPLSESQPCHDSSHTLSQTHILEGVAPSFHYPRLRSLSPAGGPSPYQGQTTLAERRKNSLPPRLIVTSPQMTGNSSLPVQTNPPPCTLEKELAPTESEWDSGSVYSRDDNEEPCAGPLRMTPNNDNYIDPGMRDSPGLHGYSAWKHSSPQAENTVNLSGFTGLRPESSGNNLGTEKSEKSLGAPRKDALYSPLTPFFADKSGPANKKGSKIMFGHNGWLERTGQTPEKKKSPQKKSMFGGLRKIAKDLATSNRPSHGEEKKLGQFSNISISLDPREQSLLYCELEFYLSCAIHGYITVQLNHGRLDADKLKKIADSWAHKGRPKVIAFRYDLETQIELVGLHIGEFRFYGRRCDSEAQISGLLHTMKVNARAMRVRTFCQPDSVIAKQLVDAQSLFNLLGVPDVQQVALQHVAQFFRVIVERERNKGMKRNSDKSQTVPTLVSY